MSRRDLLARARRASVVVCLSGLSIGLTGCMTSPGATPAASTEAATTASPSPSSTAVAETDAAVAAATEAVRSYYAVTDRLLSDPQTSVDEAASVASGEELDLLRRQVQEQRVRGLRQTGSVVLADLTATGADLQAPPTVTIDACVDVSALDVVDNAGASALAPDRTTSSVVHLTVVAAGDARWTVDRTSAQGEPCAG
ncbi:hypothetical protein FHN55_12295 [Streptomyces sp. NP160]|uniref:hypothetical protein n=1 Tax=Streptomyces sp. NP160 TaxID=2586637 RepID=UPI001117CB50|nr:hypothetical protein [Streptomyces sp. NP160]TNM66877.1 hypothetical protein FHN55_12295 [Streptomyces sp. NP160]